MFPHKVKLPFQELKVELYLGNFAASYLTFSLCRPHFHSAPGHAHNGCVAAVCNKTSTLIFQSQNLPRRQDHIFIISRRLMALFVAHSPAAAAAAAAEAARYY